jgi:hypothetical protein
LRWLNNLCSVSEPLGLKEVISTREMTWLWREADRVSLETASPPVLGKEIRGDISLTS